MFGITFLNYNNQVLILNYNNSVFACFCVLFPPYSFLFQVRDISFITFPNFLVAKGVSTVDRYPFCGHRLSVGTFTRN